MRSQSKLPRYQLFIANSERCFSGVAWNFEGVNAEIKAGVLKVLQTRGAGGYVPLSYDLKNYAKLGGCYPPWPLPQWVTVSSICIIGQLEDNVTLLHLHDILYPNFLSLLLSCANESYVF